MKKLDKNQSPPAKVLEPRFSSPQQNIMLASQSTQKATLRNFSIQKSIKSGEKAKVTDFVHENRVFTTKRTSEVEKNSFERKKSSNGDNLDQ